MGEGSGKNTLYCNNCNLRFTLYARRENRKRRVNYFCPNCGENTHVTLYEDRTRQDTGRKTWTKDEVEALKTLLTLGKRPIELAHRFGRTPLAVSKKSHRLGFRFD